MVARQAELFAEVGAILGSAATREERAAEVLRALRAVVPYAAGAVTAVRCGSVEHLSLANAGYPAGVEEYLNGAFNRADPAYLTMRRRPGRPLRWRDAADYRSSYSATEVFGPAGFDEGVTVCLRNRRGHYTGSLHLSVTDRRHPTDPAMRFLGYLPTMLGELVDLGTTVPPVPPPDGQAVVITAAGARRPGQLPPLPEALVREIRALAAADVLPAWFWWRSPGGEARLITTERIGEEISVGNIAATLPHGLSIRELEVLTLVAGGHTNTRIAHRLAITPKTVAKHVEHLLAKLDVPSRTAAAVLATRTGLLLLSPPAAPGLPPSG